MDIPISSPPPWSLRRSLPRPLGLGLLAGLLTALGMGLVPDTYRSEVRILSDTGHAGGGATLRAGVWAPAAPPETFGRREEGPTVIYVDILQSRRMAEWLLLGEYDCAFRSWRFGKPRHRRGRLLEHLGARSLDQGMGALRGMMAVRRDLKSGLLSLQVETRDPQLSMAVARRATEGLRAILVELSQAAAMSRASYLKDRLREVQGKTGELERGFQRFQATNRAWETSADPNLRFQGRQLKGEVELWGQVVANLTLNHEQALLEAQNDTQTLLLLDPGNLPREKCRPARALFSFAALCLAGAGSWVYLNRSIVHDRFIVKEPLP